MRQIVRLIVSPQGFPLSVHRSSGGDDSFELIVGVRQQRNTRVSAAIGGRTPEAAGTKARMSLEQREPDVAYATRPGGILRGIADSIVCANRAPERHFDRSPRNFFPYLHALRACREISSITGDGLPSALGIAKGIRHPYVRRREAERFLAEANIGEESG